MRALLLTFCMLLVLPGIARAGEVMYLDVEGVVGPAMADVWLEAIDVAEEARAEALLINLDTPGGMDTSMRRIIKAMLASEVPVILYVSPAGSRAASAGVFLLYAAHVSAMAPGTNLGAAHPVSMGGEKMDETMRDKVTNDAVAYVRSLADLRGRNAEWAEKAVRESVSLTAKEAVEQRVVDVMVPDVSALLTTLDGRVVKMQEGEHTLKVANATLTEVDVSWGKELLAIIANPNVAYILMMLGTYGLIYELANPGAIFPGVVGAICLILAFYAFSALPVSYAGVALILLALVLFVAEAMVSGFGLLAAGGVVSLLLGSIMLMDTDLPFLQISWSVIVPVVICSAAFTLLAAYMAVGAWRKRSVSGEEGMIGMETTLTGPLSPEGNISLQGEIWKARATRNLEPGERVRVIGFDGLTALVAPAAEVAKALEEEERENG